MADEDILRNINALLKEENELRSTGDEPDMRRLNHVEETLDQCWDLLRQRRALREFGQDPSQAHVRDPQTVENYLQ